MFTGGHCSCFNVSLSGLTGPGARVTSVFISLMDPSSNFLAAATHRPLSRAGATLTHCTLHQLPPPSQLQTHGRERGVWTPEISAGTRSLGCRKIRVIMGKGKHESMNQYLRSDTQRLCLTTNDCVPCVPCVTHLKSSRIKRQAVIFMSSFYGTDQ